MLEQVTGEHLAPLLNRPHALQLPDGSQLPIQIEAIEQGPGRPLHAGGRAPFNVQLRSLEPTEFIDGLCTLALDRSTTLRDVFVSREPAMGRDARLGYYNIVFN